MAQLASAEIMLGSALLYASPLQWYFRMFEESVTPEMLDKMMAAHVYNMELRDLLPKVRVPTLVVHYRKNRAIPFEAGRELAAGIPGARFVPLEGDSHIFYFRRHAAPATDNSGVSWRSHRRSNAASSQP
jgi:pimeloyl-ACP methyl ester carboxylesterase